MNREIKFRFWNKEKSNWESSFVYWARGTLIDKELLGVFNQESIVAQQYTGLKDKNGKEIYEGDILKELTNNELNFNIGVCKSILGGWKIFNVNDPSICWHGWKQEIIGNIFENPELLNTNNEDVIQKLKNLPSLECFADPSITVEDLEKTLIESRAVEHLQLIDEMGKEWVDKNMPPQLKNKNL